MIRSKRGLTVLGACGLIVGLVALSSSAVQAEKGANWMVNGSPVTTKLTPSVELFEVEGKDIKLSTKVAGVSVEFLCSGAQFIGANLEPEGKISSGNKTKFTGCITKLNGSLSTSCEPVANGTEKGVATSTALKGLLQLFELGGGVKDSIILFEPVTGETFLVLEFGPECSIGSKCAIIGKQSVKDSTNQLGTELVQHSVEQGPLSELWVVSKTAEHVANVSGSAKLRLSGAHLGAKWSGVPG